MTASDRKLASLFAIAPLLSAGAAAFYFGTRAVVPVITFFWFGVIATLVTLLFVRSSARLCLASVSVSVGLLWMVWPHALAWTAWSIRGFAP